MQNLPHNLERSVVIRAAPETVFRFFTDSTRWATWWGQGSTIDPVPGGKVYIRHPNGIETIGEVLEAAAPHKIVFTYGYASGNPIPPGASRVTIHLEADAGGTRLRLIHEFADPAIRDQHVQGWRFQLSLFANAVANEAFAHAAEFADGWFAAWAITDEAARKETLERIASPGVRFADKYSLLEGVADVMAHITASQRFLPGVHLERRGNIRQCQGTVLANWVAIKEGKELMSGSNVFIFDAQGKIESATGLFE
jgi:uncharacterized protein YndB with AHSA1/START domain